MTSQDLARTGDTPGAELAHLQPEPATMLERWAEQARIASIIAQQIIKTSFCPVALRERPGDVTGIIIAGSALGLDPFASMRSIDIIKGTPAMRAHMMRGLLQSQGHEIELVSSTVEKCVMRGRRRGAEAWQTAEYTIDMARRMELTGKDNWIKQPDAMLLARCTGKLARLIAADVLLGLPYTSEEVQDMPAEQQAVLPRVPVTAAEIMTGEMPAPTEPETPEPWPTPAPIPTTEEPTA